MAREMRYVHCARCDCPLTLFATDSRSRTLCISCHVQMAASSARNRQACTCAVISDCRTCRDREYLWHYRRKNQKRLSAYWMDYYYENYEAMRAQKRAHSRAFLDRRNAKRKALAALGSPKDSDI